ncbi:MAG: hydroxyphenylacetyl-CoA thioesterase PaaI [Nocardioidaceae bacterium]
MTTPAADSDRADAAEEVDRAAAAADSDAPDELARRCAEAMWADDTASRALGMTLDRVSADAATVSMTVRPDMTNGHGTVHGGIIFALADSAFAFACNSRNERTVAQACDIVFAAPARTGDRLVAEATARHRFGRNGVFDVRVSREGEVIAEFRGRSRTIGGAVIDDAP